MKRFGEKLRSAREKSGLTQEQVAGTRMATRTLQRLEDGKGNPTLATISDLADSLGITIAELLGIEPKVGVKRSHTDVDVDGVLQLLSALSRASSVRRLSVLYLLMKDEKYLREIEKLPSGLPIALALKRVL